MFSTMNKVTFIIVQCVAGGNNLACQKELYLMKYLHGFNNEIKIIDDLGHIN